MKAEKLQQFHADSLEEFNQVLDSQREVRKRCRADRRFYSIEGAQWEGKLGKQFAGRPKFEVNKIAMAITRIISEYRNNRIAVDFLPADGSDKDRTADALDSLLRADEERCTAQEAYDLAYEEKVGGGMGAWRWTYNYEDAYDPDNDYQRAICEPITDADQRVFFNLGARKKDKSDADKCWLLVPFSKKDAEKKYGSVTPWPSIPLDDNSDDLIKSDDIYLCEMFVKEDASDKLYYFKDIEGDVIKKYEDDLTDELMAEYEAIGTEHTHIRKVKKQRIRKYLMDGSKVIKDLGHIVGKHIPIVVDYGHRSVVDNVERIRGHVRHAKDMQRLKNMNISLLASISALTGVEKPIFDPQQVADPIIQNQWATDNIENHAYLTAKSLRNADGNIVQAGPLGYTKPPAIPPALAGMLQQTETDMQDILGSQQNGDELKANVSGEAIGKIQDRLNMMDYIYMDNRAIAMKYSGKVWQSMAKELYIEEGRKMKTVNEQGKNSSIEIGRKLMIDGIEADEFNLSNCNYDVITSVGPTHSTQKKATVDSCLSAMQYTTDPQDIAVLTGYALQHMDGEGMSDINDYYRMKLLKMGVGTPSDEEAAEMAKEAENTPPDANEEYLMAAKEKERAAALKLTVETEQAAAKTEQVKADTEETLLDTEIKDRESSLNLITTLEDRLTASVEPQSTSNQATVTPINDERAG